jgi:hypothetical protein
MANHSLTERIYSNSGTLIMLSIKSYAKDRYDNEWLMKAIARIGISNGR